MRVTIMFRNTYTGGDGWVYHPLTVDISDYCMVCGGKRGKAETINITEDGEHFMVDRWDNPCGHHDFYKDVYTEAQLIKVKVKANMKFDEKQKGA